MACFKVLTASIPKDKCRKVGLSYRDPTTIRKEDFTGTGKLWIDEGCMYLYDIKYRKAGKDK